MYLRQRSPALLMWLLLSLLITLSAEAGPDGTENGQLTDSHVFDLLLARCVFCHNDQQSAGGVSLSTNRDLLDQGLLDLQDPSESYLLAVVRPEGSKAPSMPRTGPPLSAEEIGWLETWIKQGADWPQELVLERDAAARAWWSLRPLARPALPDAVPIDDRIWQKWAANPVDRFIAHRLHAAGLDPSPPADRRTLIRRIYFDLLGLPPSAEQVLAFQNDRRPDAYERLVDQLLASPAYGQRWARHWLDVAHYADTHGFDKDKTRPHAWPYRDYVIDSFNSDRPYDEFVKQQIAGDALFPATKPDGIAALGFLAAGPFDWVGQIEVRNDTLEKQRVRNLDRDDFVTTVMTTFASTTAHCARCHDHKFDPVTQLDYYRLQAVFAAIDRADRAYDQDPDVATRRRELLADKQELQHQLDQLPNPSAGDSSTERTELESQIAELDSLLAGLPEPMLVYAAAGDFAAQGAFTPTHGIPRDIYLLKRGDESSPDRERGKLAPAALSILPDLGEYFSGKVDADDATRRAELAHWLTDPQNPLTWRSVVNRIWQYHFGAGLVETPNDFGRMGGVPSHPDLLDWLAVEFRQHGGSWKHLHRLICCSAAYQQASDVRSDGVTIDAENRLIWRFEGRRLSAEELYDSVLLAAGCFDSRMGGPSFQDFAFEDDHSPRYRYEDFDPSDSSSWRRSIYRFVVRSAPDPFFTALDCADPSVSVGRRHETMTPLHALAILNSRLVLEMARQMARRTEKESADLTEQVRFAFRSALQRDATEQELVVLRGLAERHGLAQVCRTLFNLNEFVFVD